MKDSSVYAVWFFSLRDAVIPAIAVTALLRCQQILRKNFVQTRIREFVNDLNAESLHRQVLIILRVKYLGCVPVCLG